jgi:hypothetical protein
MSKRAARRLVSLTNQQARDPKVWNTPFFRTSSRPSVSNLRQLQPSDLTVFVSHRRADPKPLDLLWDFLGRLQSFLDKKLMIWSDGWGIPREKDLQWRAVEEIPALLSESDVLIFVFTSDFINSPWCVLEILVALLRRNISLMFTLPGESLEMLASSLRSWDSLPSIKHLARHEQKYLESMYKILGNEHDKEDLIIWQMKLTLLIGLSMYLFRQNITNVDLASFLTSTDFSRLGGTLPADALEAQAIFIDALRATGWRPRRCVKSQQRLSL